MEKQIDSLKTELDNTYKPGLGEFMSSLQMHHAKLWFAGINNNRILADFEINELKETIDDIEKYCGDRKESKMIRAELGPAIDTVTQSFLYQGNKSSDNFRKGFILLTNSCNDCHRKNSFGFNVVTVPTISPVSNQDFKPQTRKDTTIVMRNN